VNLTLSYRGDYVVRAALFLAASWNDHASYSKVKEISDGMRLPLSYTPQILGLLSRAGIVESRAGRGGGYRLTRPPSEVSLLDVVEAADGKLQVERCPIRGDPCRPEDPCLLHPAWSKAASAVQDSLGDTALADLVASRVSSS